MKTINIQDYLNTLSGYEQEQYIQARNTAKRLFRILPSIEFEKMVRKIIKNNGRTSPQFYGFDSIQNPDRYTNAGE